MNSGTEENRLVAKIKETGELVNTLMNEWLKAKDTKILDFAHDKRAELVALQEKLKSLQSKTSKPPATGTSGTQAIPLVTPSTRQIGGIRSHLGGIPNNTAGPSVPNNYTPVGGQNSVSPNAPPSTGPGSPRGTAPYSGRQTHPLTFSSLQGSANTSGLKESVLTADKLVKLHPIPVGYTGVNGDPKVQKLATTMPAAIYLGHDSGLAKYVKAIQNHCPAGVINPETQKLMIYMITASWETQRVALLQKIPEMAGQSLDIQLLEAYRAVCGKKKWSEMDNVNEFIDALRDEYINEDTIRAQVAGLRKLGQTSDIWSYVAEFSAAALALDAVAPGRLTENEKLNDFLFGITDDNIKRAIRYKVDIRTATLGEAIDAIEPDIQEAKRKYSEGHGHRDRDRGGRQQGLNTYENGRSESRAENMRPPSQKKFDPTQKPVWQGPEARNVYAFRMLHGGCARCGDPSHNQKTRLPSGLFACPVKPTDNTKKGTPNQFDFNNKNENYKANFDYTIEWDAKMARLYGSQSVADHSRLQARGHGKN